jgi:hypothetical protein
VLARCVRGGGPKPAAAIRALTAGDRDRLLFAAWRLALGPRMELVLHCPECGALMDAETDVVVAGPEPPAPTAGGRVRAVTGEDLEAAAGVDDPAAELLRRCAGAGSEAPELRAELDEELERLDPGAVSDLEAACPECGATFTSELDPAAALLSELGRRRPQLDGDVHLLSLHYHWPLREILGLARLDRRAYVERLLSRLGAPAA